MSRAVPQPPQVDAGEWARFTAQVIVIPGRCHLWLGPPRDDGYAQFWVPRPAPAGRPVRAHRYAWEAWRGPLPPASVVRHRCDEPLCTPLTAQAVDEHLAVGTQADNVDDRDRRGRGARPRHRLRTWTVDRRGMAARSRALHAALHEALAAGATPHDLGAVLDQVSQDGAQIPGQVALL